MLYPKSTEGMRRGWSDWRCATWEADGKDLIPTLWTDVGCNGQVEGKLTVPMGDFVPDLQGGWEQKTIENRPGGELPGDWIGSSEGRDAGGVVRKGAAGHAIGPVRC